MGVPIETMEKVFFASIAHDRAGTRGGARDATSDLGHAPRRSSRLPSLGLSRSRRPAGLAPWGAGLGACGVEGGRKGSRGQSQSRVVSGQRFWQPPLGVVSVGRDSRSRGGRRPRPETRGRRWMRDHSRPSSSFPSWPPSRTFPLRGRGLREGLVSAGVGEGWQARAGGARVSLFPAIWFSGWRGKRAGERTIGRVPSGRLTVNQGIRRRVHVAAVLLEHGDDIVLSLAGDRAERLNLVPRHLCVCVSLPCDRSLDSLCVPSLPRIA